MKDDQLGDLKQFITATVSQTEATLVEKIEKLEQKMEDGFLGVGDAIESLNEHTEEAKNEIDTRLSKLEKQAV